ncbi:MAG TPA: Ig-like domain-containing protein [Candidatus Eisenbacteria bacterium]
MISGPKLLLVFSIPAALLLLAGACFGQPRVVATYPPNGAERVPANAILMFAFDRPTAKHAFYSVADITAGGGLITTSPDRWSPQGDTLYITPLDPLPFGHFFSMKLTLVQDADSTIYSNPTYYREEYYFSTAAQSQVERVQAGNVNLALTPDVTLPVSIPVRELAGTDVSFTSARVQFLPFEVVANTGPTPLDASVMPLYEYTVPLSTFLRRNGVASLTAPVMLPGAIARAISRGVLGVRLTFYGTDETASAVVVDACFRVDPATVACHQASVLPAIASDVLVLSATLEWPLHGAVIAAGDTILPRAVVTGNGTGAFRAAFYMDGDLIAIEEGYMEAGRPVEVAMRGPLPTRRLGEHRLQFQVEAPQPFAANPVSFVCAPPPIGLEPPTWQTPQPPPVTPGRFRGSVTWLAEGRSGFRGEDPSAVGWGAWSGAYDLGPTRRIEAVASMRLRFDDVGNGRGTPHNLKVRYSAPNASLEWSDAPPQGASETPLFMSPVPRRSAQASWRGTPLGDLDGYLALESHPISAAGPIREAQSDLYAARLGRSWLKNRARTLLYLGYTHEDATPGGIETQTRTRAIYGGMGTFDLPGTWTLLADAATVRHRAIAGVEEGRSRTGWRGELQGTALGFTALAQAFSYQPALATALNPYALSDRRGGYARLTRAVWKWRVFGSFRSEEPAARDGLVPIVRVQTGSFGGRLELNQDSWVTPSIVRVTHHGANTDLTENRLATEYTVSEPLGGRTTARFDVAFLDDAMRVATKRRVVSGSLLTTRKHPGRVVSTLALGIEQNRVSDLHLTDTTIQGSFEARWEAVVGRLLLTPFLAGSSRNYQLLGTREDRYAARFQAVFLRVPGLGENAVSLEGRVDRVQHRTPSRPSDLDGSVQLTIGQRFGVGGL